MKLKVFLAVLALTTVSTAFLFDGVTKSPVKVPTTKLKEQPKVSIVSKENSEEKQIVKINIPSTQIVVLSGIIDSANAHQVAAEISVKGNSGRDLYLLIDSPGGSVLDGALILSAIESSTSDVYTVCMGLCASMAFVIHQYGHQRLAVDRAILMAHPASGGLEGTLEQMNSRLSLITRYVDKMDLHLAKRLKMNIKDFKALIVSEFWVDSEDALLKGFVDQLVYVNTNLVFVNPLSLPSDEKGKKNEKIRLVW